MNPFQFHNLGLQMMAIGRQRILIAVSLLATAMPSCPVGAVPLTDLLTGSSISVGDCLFTDWELVFVDATAATPNMSLVTVNPLTNDLGAPGLQFVGNNQLVVSGMNALDLELKYRVQALPAGNSFEGHSLTVTNLSFGTGAGVGLISDGLVTSLGANLESAVAIGDPTNGVFQLAHTAVFSSQSSVFVTTKVLLQGFALGDSVNLSTFNQRFLQTGPPILPGDYNDDGVVNAADYTFWRDRHGAAAGSLPNDVNGGTIGPPHYNTWKAQFGAAGGSGTGQAAAVPEPACLVMALLAAGSLFFHHRR